LHHQKARAVKELETVKKQWINIDKWRRERITDSAPKVIYS